MTTAFLPAVRSDCIIDLSHNNAIANPAAAFASAAKAGIALVFNKATQGIGFVDQTYAARSKAAAAAGLLLGAYHFCDSSDPVAQADHFLSVVGDPTGVLLVLDAEPYAASQASVATVASIASRIFQRVGRWPVLYMGRSGPDGTGKGLPSATLANCQLWLPEYGTNPVCPAGFASWVMWQHTDGKNGSAVASVPGIGAVDRSCFAGTLDELRAWFDLQTGAAAIVAPASASPIPAPAVDLKVNPSVSVAQPAQQPNPTPAPVPQPPAPKTFRPATASQLQARLVALGYDLGKTGPDHNGVDDDPGELTFGAALDALPAA